MLKYKGRLVYGDTLISENRENGVVLYTGLMALLTLILQGTPCPPQLLLDVKVRWVKYNILMFRVLLLIRHTILTNELLM